MKHDTLGDAGLSYAPCRYGLSRIFFRGPRRPLDGSYVAFVGGTETYGKYIEHPFPALVEPSLGAVCANFGIVNASVDAFIHDPSVLSICNDAEVTVLQVMGAQNLSNRFYKVHPRRNDRFLSASTVLSALYADVDFSDFTFTRHMLSTLYARSPERFEILRVELQNAWVARMRLMVEQLGPRVVLLWFSETPLSDDPWNVRPHPFRADPMFVTRTMVETLRDKVLDIVEAQPSPAALARGTAGMVFPFTQSEAASELLGVAAHEEAAARLIPVLRKAIA